MSVELSLALRPRKLFKMSTALSRHLPIADTL